MNPSQKNSNLSRRRVLGGLGLAAFMPLLPEVGFGQGAARSQLPLKTPGLEHMGTVVPDVTAAAKFYGRIFNPEVHKEKDPPLRYYVTLGVGYLALGTRATESRAFFDHFCALVEDYDAKAMAAELTAKGLPAGRFGIIPDPDGIGFQLLNVPGGLAKSTEPAGRIVEEDALVKPIGLTEVVLHVPDIDKSLGFYRQFLGKEAGRKPSEAWFDVANTKLRIEQADSGEAPRVNRIAVKVQKFDRKSVSAELEKLGAKLEKGARDGVRFRDPLGLGLELVSA